jgi:hypothetical protein
MKRATKVVKAADIRIDGGTQSRVDIDPHWIHEMVDNMKNDVEYPLIEARFDGVHYWLTDGFHRYHAYTQLGIKEIEVSYLPGTQFDAQLDSYKANSKHGKPRTRADKAKAVESALANPLVEDKSNYAIAQICEVSQSFVASVRNPKAKQKQADAKKRHIIKKAEELKAGDEVETESVTSQTSNQSVVNQSPVGGEEPDEAELIANQKKQEADLETLGKFLDADDKMKHLYEENKRLNHLVVMKDLRIKELMNEKSAAVKMVKDLQKQLDKQKAKK